MLTFVRLCLLLGAFSALVSAQTESSLTKSALYNNCSGNLAHPPPNNAESTPYYKPQIRINPLDINKNGTAWEEWLFISHNRLEDGSELVYGYKFALGDPTSANVSHQTLIAWAYFPNGTFYRQIGHGQFMYDEYPDGSFTYSIGDSHLTWDYTRGVWNTSISIEGYIIKSVTANVEPGIPFGPDYKSKQGQISEGFFSRIEAPRAHSDGIMIFPWGLNHTIQSVGSLRHTWSNKIMADTVSALVRGSTFLPNLPPIPIGSLNWFQAWDNAGKEVDSMQYLAQPDGVSSGQIFRFQATDKPEAFSVVTTPKPVGLPLSYTSTEITLPMCGPGAKGKAGNEKMVWKVNNMYTLIDFVDFAGGHTLYQRVNVTGRVWTNGTAADIFGVGIVEIYHRA